MQSWCCLWQSLPRTYASSRMQCSCIIMYRIARLSAHILVTQQRYILRCLTCQCIKSSCRQFLHRKPNYWKHQVLEERRQVFEPDTKPVGRIKSVAQTQSWLNHGYHLSELICATFVQVTSPVQQYTFDRLCVRALAVSWICTSGLCDNVHDYTHIVSSKMLSKMLSRDFEIIGYCSAYWG